MNSTDTTNEIVRKARLSVNGDKYELITYLATHKVVLITYIHGNIPTMPVVAPFEDRREGDKTYGSLIRQAQEEGYVTVWSGVPCYG